MLKFLKGVVAGSGAGVKDLPYNVGEPYSSAWGSWTHSRGTSKAIHPSLSLSLSFSVCLYSAPDDGSAVSVFSLSGSNANDGHLAAGRNGVKRLRTVRHPNILSFLHSTEAETFDGSSAKVTIYIVTEPVMPLKEKVKELGLEGTQRDEYYAWGLHRIAKAVSFLNNDCKLVHGNVCLESVVVTQTLDWKLHAFDVLSEYDGNNEAVTGPMLQYEWLIGSQYKPMELAKSDWAAIRKSPPWAIDSWGLGKSFSGPLFARLSATLEFYAFSQVKFIKACGKLCVEKDTFFRKLPNLAEQLPRQIVLKKLLPLLASALEFGSAAAPALTALLKLGAWLSADEFSIKVVPTIVKLFASNDRAIRVSLLQHIDQYGEALSAQTIDEQVYPHVATGFTDTSAFLREMTLKSMLVLAPKLSQRTLSGSLLKYLSKLQIDDEPAIRTNTTILLGNIASLLNEGTRKRVLLNAFAGRALRDQFSPARGAGLVALCATSSYYEATEVATKILPVVVVLTLDPDSDVRSKAFQTVDQFLQMMRQYHEKVCIILDIDSCCVPEIVTGYSWGHVGSEIVIILSNTLFYQLSSGDTTEPTSIGISSITGNASLIGLLCSSTLGFEAVAGLPECRSVYHLCFGVQMVAALCCSEDLDAFGQVVEALFGVWPSAFLIEYGLGTFFNCHGPMCSSVEEAKEMASPLDTNKAKGMASPLDQLT
ncbi:hypothetical protein RJ640_026245 [Escallonia rubra]|uniref:Protein kinase domain-containing protein n=1 Tax=Escallonia rubra TaxID=112253 RepID=A0AA88R595_9ASTE|nr:hypothetical protein RJ640_026245 [Escallonia rubra]